MSFTPQHAMARPALRRARGLVLWLGLAVAGCARPTEPAAAAPDGRHEREPTSAMPEPIDVCVGPEEALERRRAVPSRAGVYDPSAPIVGRHLNWVVDGLGCVTYPPDAATVLCQGETLPWVSTALCQQ